MKTLLILRHAKSSWKDPMLTDHERPLKKRGRRAAPRMGRWILSQGLVPQVILCSTAARARKTAELAAEACGFSGEITFLDSLYGGGSGASIEALRALPPEVDTAMVVGHNPDLEELVCALTAATERMPTAALAHVELDVGGWGDLWPSGQGRLRALWRPKELPEE